MAGHAGRRACARPQADVSAQEDESRLLFDDPNGMHYGSFGEQQINGQDDPLEVQREIEALQRVVARTSEYLSPSPPRSPLPAWRAGPG